MLMAMLLAATPVPNPRATELFDAEPVLKSWALKEHDRNHDGWLTLYEASEAAAAFKALADADGDGRVTVREFDAAKAFLASRYGIATATAD